MGHYPSHVIRNVSNRVLSFLANSPPANVIASLSPIYYYYYITTLYSHSAFTPLLLLPLVVLFLFFLSYTNTRFCSSVNNKSKEHRKTSSLSVTVINLFVSVVLCFVSFAIRLAASDNHGCSGGSHLRHRRPIVPAAVCRRPPHRQRVLRRRLVGELVVDRNPRQQRRRKRRRFA